MAKSLGQRYWEYFEFAIPKDWDFNKKENPYYSLGIFL